MAVPHHGDAGPVEMTARESQILGLLAEGKTTKEIAVALKLSCDTIGTHRKHLCRKLGAHSTAELIAHACHSRPAE
jgi:DNA-binding CsgD family transcriptional regulator